MTSLRPVPPPGPAAPRPRITATLRITSPRHDPLLAITPGITRPRRAQRTPLIRLALQGQRQQWRHACDDILPPGTGRYLDLEHAAADIRTYTARLIPELLQTPSYTAAALTASRPGLSRETVIQLAVLQAQRQKRHAAAGTPAPPPGRHRHRQHHPMTTPRFSLGARAAGAGRPATPHTDRTQAAQRPPIPVRVLCAPDGTRSGRLPAQTRP